MLVYCRTGPKKTSNVNANAFSETVPISDLNVDVFEKYSPANEDGLDNLRAMLKTIVDDSDGDNVIRFNFDKRKLH